MRSWPQFEAFRASIWPSNFDYGQLRSLGQPLFALYPLSPNSQVGSTLRLRNLYVPITSNSKWAFGVSTNLSRGKIQTKNPTIGRTYTLKNPKINASHNIKLCMNPLRGQLFSIFKMSFQLEQKPIV